MEVSSHSSQLPLVKRFLYEVSLFLGPISRSESFQKWCLFCTNSDIYFTLPISSPGSLTPKIFNASWKVLRTLTHSTPRPWTRESVIVRMSAKSSDMPSRLLLPSGLHRCTGPLWQLCMEWGKSEVESSRTGLWICCRVRQCVKIFEANCPKYPNSPKNNQEDHKQLSIMWISSSFFIYLRVLALHQLTQGSHFNHPFKINTSFFLKGTTTSQLPRMLSWRL